MRPSSMWGLDSKYGFAMNRYSLFISLVFLLNTLTSCYDQQEKFAIVSGFLSEDGTKTKGIAREDCTPFSLPVVPSTISSGGLMVNLVIIQITFEYQPEKLRRPFCTTVLQECHELLGEQDLRYRNRAA